MRFIVAHFRDAIVVFDGPVAAHCFGPFDDLDAVARFTNPGDSCFKLVIPIVGPGEYDVALAEADERRHHADHR